METRIQIVKVAYIVGVHPLEYKSHMAILADLY